VMLFMAVVSFVFTAKTDLRKTRLGGGF